MGRGSIRDKFLEGMLSGSSSTRNIGEQNIAVGVKIPLVATAGVKGFCDGQNIPYDKETLSWIISGYIALHTFVNSALLKLMKNHSINYLRRDKVNTAVDMLLLLKTGADPTGGKLSNAVEYSDMSLLKESFKSLARESVIAGVSYGACYFLGHYTK